MLRRLQPSPSGSASGFPISPGGFSLPLGLWEHWERNDGASMESCKILACGPDEVTSDPHNGMPPILPTDWHEGWRNPTVQGEPLH